MKKLFVLLAVLVMMLSGCVPGNDDGAVAVQEETQTDPPVQTQQPKALEPAPEPTEQPVAAPTEEPEETQEETQEEASSVAETQQGLGEVEDMLDGLGDLGDIDFSE